MQIHSYNLLYSDNRFDYVSMSYLRGEPKDLYYRAAYVNKADQLVDANKLTGTLLQSSIIGFDTETALTNIGQDNMPPTIIQYGSEELVIMINVSTILKQVTLDEFWRRMPNLKDLLQSNTNVKVGLDLVQDLHKMSKLGITVSTVVDIQSIALCLGYTERGLNSIAEKIIGAEKHGTTDHDWNNVTEHMLHYAARDAVLPVLIFNRFFEPWYIIMLSQLIPNLVPQQLYDVFDLAVIMMNHSKHDMRNQVNIRNFIIRSMALFGITVETMVSNNYLGKMDKQYYLKSGISTTIQPINNQYQFVPLDHRKYSNTKDPETYNKLKYYDEQQRIRLLTPEENTTISLLLGSSSVSTNNPPVANSSTLTNVRNILPNISNSDANRLALAIDDYDTYADEYKKLPKNPVGMDKNRKPFIESKLRKANKALISITSQHSITPEQLGINIIPIADTISTNSIVFPKPKPYGEQISLDYIIKNLPSDALSSDINTLIVNVNNIQEAMSVIKSNPDNSTLNVNINKYNSNISKLKQRIHRLRIKPELFLHLAEPFIVQ